MTSNIGAHIIQERLKGIDENNRDEVLDKTNHEVYEMLKQTILPGVLEPYRRDHHVCPVEEVGNRGYCTFAINGVKKMLENNGIAIEITDQGSSMVGRCRV